MYIRHDFCSWEFLSVSQMFTFPILFCTWLPLHNACVHIDTFFVAFVKFEFLRTSLYVECLLKSRLSIFYVGWIKLACDDQSLWKVKHFAYKDSCPTMGVFEQACVLFSKTFIELYSIVRSALVTEWRYHLILSGDLELLSFSFLSFLSSTTCW